jgi:tRNA modification GTPase
MHDVHDTICAIATPGLGMRTILRISGPQALEVCQALVRGGPYPESRGVFRVQLGISQDLALEGLLYLFPSPHSYTGQPMAEIHVEAPPPVTEALVRAALGAGARPAGPGEFTARAYLNGKIDLAAAEAVNEVVSCTNHIQCVAAQRALRGRLSASLEALRRQILEALGLIEATLDFADEGLPDNLVAQAEGLLRRALQQLEHLLSEAVHVDSIAHHPCVGIAGLPNVGKSTLFNALLGTERSLVCDRQKTTRDVLEAILDLPHVRCVLFDCAGLVPHASEVLDVLAQRAALQSLSGSDLVLFCVEVTARHWQQDLATLGQLSLRSWVCVATKADQLAPKDLAARLDLLATAFGRPFLPVSSRTGMNLDTLRDLIDQRLVAGPSLQAVPEGGQFHTLLTARLRQSGALAADCLNQAISALGHGQEEIAAMMARAACEAISEADRPVEEEVLDAIFSRFCVGK